jgi:hypothetical protein
MEVSMIPLRLDVLNLPRGGYLPEWGALPVVANKFLRKAADQIDYGEVGGNNAGEFVAAVKRRPWVDADPGFLRRGNKAWPGLDLGAWCGSGTSWCLEETLRGISGLVDQQDIEEAAAWYVGVPTKYWRANRHRALVLGAMLGDRFGRSLHPIVGGVMVLDRGPGLGHISPCIAAAGDVFYTIEFNRGIPPTKVRPYFRGNGGPHLRYFAKIC